VANFEIVSVNHRTFPPAFQIDRVEISGSCSWAIIGIAISVSPDSSSIVVSKIFLGF
jgi:hypothetical protein